MNYFEMGDKLIEARKSHGWTVPEEAKKAKVSIRTIRRYEHAEQVPRVDTLAKLADLLGLSLDYLVGFTNK